MEVSTVSRRGFVYLESRSIDLWHFIASELKDGDVRFVLNESSRF
jgi:hypothetical protein